MKPWQRFILSWLGFLAVGFGLGIFWTSVFSFPLWIKAALGWIDMIPAIWVYEKVSKKRMFS